MSDTERAARWALEDEELEALMIGATPEDLGRIGNPVAEFFVDTRNARGVRSPSPDDSLRQLFAGEGQFFGSAEGVGQPRASTPPHPAGAFNEPTRVAPSDPFGVEPTSSRLVPPGPVRPEPRPEPSFMSLDVAPIAGAHDVSGFNAPDFGGPDFGGPDFGAPDYEATFMAQQPRGSLLSEHTAAHNRVVVAPNEVYDSSPVEFLSQAIRPNATKVLMGLAMVALAFTAGQLLGVLNLPIFGDSGVDNQATAEADLAASGAGLADGAAGDQGTLGEQESPAPADGVGGLVTVPLPATALAAPETAIATPAPTAAANTTTPTISVSTTASVVESTVASSDTTIDPALTTTVVDPDATTTIDPAPTTETSTDTSDTTVDGSSTTVEETTSTVAEVVPDPGATP